MKPHHSQRITRHFLNVVKQYQNVGWPKVVIMCYIFTVLYWMKKLLRFYIIKNKERSLVSKELSLAVHLSKHFTTHKNHVRRVIRQVNGRRLRIDRQSERWWNADYPAGRSQKASRPSCCFRCCCSCCYWSCCYY